jgi:hypothetical protein
LTSRALPIIIKRINLIGYISYPEWRRDWPNEAQQPACSLCMVLIPGAQLCSKDKEDGQQALFISLACFFVSGLCERGRWCL